jgi:hypothetical protein
MKTLRTLLVIAVAIFAFSTISFGQETASASAKSTIVTPISIKKDVDMNFGNVAVQSSNGGTVVLAPDGGRTATDGVTLPATAGDVSAASFTVGGTGAYTYTITLPTSAVTIKNGTNTMTITDFKSTPSGTGALSSGTQTLTVGATLNVGAAQAAGEYTTVTPFDVTVNYN